MQDFEILFFEELKRKITASILSEGKPEKIYIFGSYATKNATKNSDIDIAIIEKTELKKGKRAAKYFRKLRELSIPKDIIVYTPEEFESRKYELNSLPYSIYKEGVLIFG